LVRKVVWTICQITPDQSWDCIDDLPKFGFRFLNLIKRAASRIHNGELSRIDSISNSLHFFEQNLLTATVIKFRSSAVSVTADSLSGFKGAVIFQKIRDAGRPK